MTPEQAIMSLCDPASAGVYRSAGLDDSGLAALLAQAGARGCLAVRIDLSRTRDRDGLFATIGTSLRFPDWFGANWDALQDCLGDMGWQPAEAYLLVFTGCEPFASRSAADFEVLINVLQAAADEWRDRGLAFSAMIVFRDGLAGGPAAGLPELSIPSA